jgi:hypothetical protein
MLCLWIATVYSTCMQQGNIQKWMPPTNLKQDTAGNWGLNCIKTTVMEDSEECICSVQLLWFL